MGTIVFTMQTKNKAGYLPERREKRLRRMVGHLALDMINNTTLVKAGYDLALARPDLVKRVDRRVQKAHSKVKVKLVRFMAELEDVVGCPMPWAFVSCGSREEAMARFGRRTTRRRLNRKPRPNQPAGGDGGTPRLRNAGRPSPSAPHHERWAMQSE
jgi:hypothetical protein